MTRTTLLLLAVGSVCADLAAQSNSRGSGYNPALTNISSARAWGRRGPAYPGGEVGVSFQNELCNPGSIPVEWRQAMQADHPKFSFLVVKQDGDRLIQISDWSYCKHAFLSLNSSSTCGGSCVQPPNGGAQLGVSCSDVYSNSNNGSRTWLGPPQEIDPWLGTWNPVGSYFDRGDPDVGPPGNNDGARSPINVGSDAVKNRVTIREADVQGGASGLIFQIQVLSEGEPAGNRDNNIMSRTFNLSWNGSSWSATTSGSATYGSVLTRWAGASLSTGGNGNDDGRFLVAVKVTGPTDGLWHYDYAVQNIDNNRGGASFRVPVCTSARVLNPTFRDIDTNALNDWTVSVGGGEIAFQATATNPHNWNTIYNFAFDSDAAPVAGTTTIDQARLGPGAANVSVASQVPGFVPTVWLGDGCGAPAVTLTPFGVPTVPNPAFSLLLQAAPNTGALAFFAFDGASVSLGSGCTQFLDPSTIATHGFLLTNGSGTASIPLGVPPGLPPIDVYWQAATLQSGGPALGSFNLSNGLRVRVGGSGCP
jgi:hypothetical protein